MFSTGTGVEEKAQKNQKNISSPTTSFYTPQKVLLGVAVTAAYLLGSYLLTGLRSDQMALAVVIAVLYFAAPITRRFLTGFSIFLLYWVIFDWMKAFPNYRFNEVSIQGLYEAEKSLFGIAEGATRLTPNEYLTRHTSAAADIIAGIFYVCWVPLPWGYAIYLFFKNRKTFFNYALTFFGMNAIGFIIYYAYPAAPPWYVAQYGFDFIANTPGNTAGLARFDAITGTDTFASIYSKSSNVFAAMPSMHAGDIFLATVFTFKNRDRFAAPVFALFAVGICVSAIYTSHHYVLDVLAGIGCALLAMALIHWFINKTNAGRNLFAKLMSATDGNARKTTVSR